MHELNAITGVDDCTLLNNCKCLLSYAASDSRKEIKILSSICLCQTLQKVCSVKYVIEFGKTKLLQVTSFKNKSVTF